MTQGGSLFGRYIATSSRQDPALLNSPDNVLTVDGGQGRDNLAQAITIGDTYVLGASTVHSFRFAFNRSAVQRKVAPYFSPTDLGIAAHNYSPVAEIGFSVDDGFSLGGGTSSTGIFNTNDFQVADDLTVVRGRHQLSIGGNVAYWKSNQESHARSAGAFTVDGSVTGLGLGDFLLGRVANLEHGGPSGANMEQWYLGFYTTDTWRASDRITLNLGLRWEPFFGQQMQNGDVAVFLLENFQQGVRSTVFRNAPAGFLYPGDPGFPEGKSGMNRQWGNLSPRLGVAWDVSGDGRTALRFSYGIGYDFPTGEVHLINAPRAGRHVEDVRPVRYGRQPELPARVVSAESGRGAVAQQFESVHRPRHAGVSRTEAVDAAARRHRREPQRELHLVLLLGERDARRVSSAQ